MNEEERRLRDYMLAEVEAKWEAAKAGFGSRSILLPDKETMRLAIKQAKHVFLEISAPLGKGIKLIDVSVTKREALRLVEQEFPHLFDIRFHETAISNKPVRSVRIALGSRSLADVRIQEA